MQNTLKLFGKLVCLKASPEELPYSQSLLYTIIGALFFLQMLSASNAKNFKMGDALIAYLASIALSVIIIGAILVLKKMLIRWRKLLIAMFGVELFFVSLLLLTLNLINSLVPVLGMEAVGGLFFLFLICFLFWNIAVRINILSIGLGESKLVAFIIWLFYELIRNTPLLMITKPIVEKSVQ